MRTIAFFLPQYHPTPENDAWWGKGFTEWRNVTKAQPLFPGHYQPHLPADLGFYDLRLPEVREGQAALARQYGIHGFCYYHYWFGGRRILEHPVNEILGSGRPDFPFCLCWANENWTRAWDGGEKEILLAQDHSEEDDREHIQALIPALRDPRYIRIDGRPLLLVYRTELLPDPKNTAAIWREEARRNGIRDIYLARVESFVPNINPIDIGFDAAVGFAPDWRREGDVQFRTPLFRKAVEWGLLPDLYFEQCIYRYDALMRNTLSHPLPTYTHFRGVTPGFDNSARRTKKGAAIFLGSTPEKYGAWLEETARRTLAEKTGDEQIVFINAWNEWAEGNHLEPDLKYGHAYLEATRTALEAAAAGSLTPRAAAPEPGPPSPAPARPARSASLREAYWRLHQYRREASEVLEHIRFWQCRRRLRG